jgi:peptide/nickel transport system substrate-binding protein
MRIFRLKSTTVGLVIGLGILLSVSVATASPAFQEDCVPSGEVERGGELMFARHEEPLTLDPVIPNDNGSIYAIEQIFSALTRPDATGEGIEPDAAESWDISDDGLVYTFHLRDAKFSNGDPVTAEDMVFSLERGRGPESGFGGIFAAIDTIEALDESTVQMTLHQPYSPLLSVASIFYGMVVPKAVFEADPDGFGDHPIGSGPWMVEEFTRGDKLVLVPNPHYWELGVDCQPLPYLDKITIAYVPESNSRILGLRNGDFNAVSGVPYNEAANLDADEDIVLHVAPIYRLDYVYLNHLAPPLDSEEFRLALNYALDRQAIIDNVFFGYGQLPNAFWPLMNFNSDDVPLIPYDPDKARELLDEAGYSGEALEVLLAAGESSDKQIATILQQFWSAVGINVELVEVDSSFSLVAEGEYQAAVGYITSDINDDDELTTLQATLDNDTSSFFTWYDNPEVGPLLAQARESLDPEVRADLYAQVQEMVYWDGYSVPLNYTPAVNAIGTNVRNWQNLTTGWWWLRTVWLDQ